MHIMNSDVFRAGAEAIANLRPCPMEGRVTADQIKIALVEHLDIAPACILDDVAGDAEPRQVDDADDLAATRAELNCMSE